MKHFLLITTLLFTFPLLSNAQKTVGGVKIPEKLKAGKTTLVLNGAGVREKMWLDLYACGLYIPKKSTNANEIIESKEPCAIKIHIVSALISSKKMNAAVEEGFEKSTSGNTAKLRDRIDAFKAIFSKEEIEKNDIYDIVYVPGKGTIIFKNGKIQPIIKGLDFKKALFAIWLGDEPADDDLKEELLGN